MEFEFDKEIDALLRQAAQGETAFAAKNPQFAIGNPHLDADEISLFAENALPVKARERAVVHFADCDRCRRILSDLIAQKPENEIVSSKQSEVFAPAIPWYRKLFAFPNLAYTLGGLVLVFSGIAAFTLLQSVDNLQNAEVSQVSEQPLKGGPFLDDTAIVEEQSANTIMSSNSMSNASMSNTASTSSLNMMMSNASTNSDARRFNANLASNSSIASNKSTVSTNESAKEEPRREEETTGNIATALPLQSRTAKSLTEEKQERTKEDKKDTETTDNAIPAPPKPEQPLVSDDDRIMSGALSAKSKKLSRLKNVETSSVGGKTFKRAGKAWIDSAYKGQATINVTRGTSKFKKLDSGLRLITENLGGTVTIVWKDKAYRIQ